MFKKYKIKKYNSGMTLVELMVVLAIFAIISLITMFDYSRFQSTVSLQNLSDDVALSIRKAQSLAIGAKGIDNNFANGFGVHFSTSDGSKGDTQGNKLTFIIFSNEIDEDNENDDNSYTYQQGEATVCGMNNYVSGEAECIELLSINTGDYISGFLIVGKEGIQTGDLDITFKRPEPRATFYFREEDADSADAGDEVGVIISNAKGDSRKIIRITKVGQISVDNYPVANQ